MIAEEALRGHKDTYKGGDTVPAQEVAVVDLWGSISDAF